MKAVVGLAAVAIVVVGIGGYLLVTSTTSKSPPLQNCLGRFLLRQAQPVSPFPDSVFNLEPKHYVAFEFTLSEPSTIQGSFNSTAPVSFYLLNQTQYAGFLLNQTQYAGFLPTHSGNYTFAVQGVTKYTVSGVKLAPGRYDAAFLNVSDKKGLISLPTDWTACPPQSP